MNRLILILCATLAAGCSRSDPEAQPRAQSQSLAFSAPTTVRADCESCFEPAVASDAQGRIYVTAARLGGVAVSRDAGRTFTIKPVPFPSSPTPFAGGSGDAIVQVAPWGTLYYTALWSDTGGILGGGIHFAASDDAGDTWDVQFVHLREMPTSRSFTADRQWLAFDGDSTIYLVFNCGASAFICSMRSDDRGQTWGLPVDVVHVPDHTFPSPEGFPTVGPDGTLIIPYFADVRQEPVPSEFDPANPTGNVCLGARTIRIASSIDRGQTFRQHTVYAHPALDEGTCGGGWPEATILADGTWVANWGTDDDRLWFSASRDGGTTWSEPTILPPEVSGGSDHPWILPRKDGGFDALWATNDPSPRLGRFTRDLQLVSIATVPELGGVETDYPYFDHLSGDRVATAYLTPDGKLRYSATNR